MTWEEEAGSPAPPVVQPDTSWARAWNEVQLVFSDGTVSSLIPGGELQVRMVHLARNLLSSGASPRAEDPSTPT